MEMKSKDIRHYFVSTDHDEKDFFEFSQIVDNINFKFTSSPDVFSKDQLDLGSLILIKTLKNSDFQGEILDMCCGYGTIGIILSKLWNTPIDMCDINTLALKLCKINAEKNNICPSQIFESNLWQNVNKQYNHIVSNPPIKVGKKVLVEFLEKSIDFLESNGDISIVIKKNLGADSTKKLMQKIYGNCEVLKREKGYYILQSTKA